MSREIERKFLVANEGWKTAVIRSVRIRDGLIANNKGHKARVRIANDVATIALKSRRRGPVRTEFEYAISDDSKGTRLDDPGVIPAARRRGDRMMRRRAFIT